LQAWIAQINQPAPTRKVFLFSHAAIYENGKIVNTPVADETHAKQPAIPWNVLGSLYG
jgi:hypothetical protein